MPTFLDDWISRLSRLRTDRGKDRWPAATDHRAPHKPLLLLALFDLIDQGVINQNRIELTTDLSETFARYWSCVPVGRDRGKILYPFFYLRSDGFWHLVAQLGNEALLTATRQVSSASQLRQLVSHATLDGHLFSLLTIRASRDELRLALIQAYFDAPTQTRLIEQAAVNSRAFSYSRQLLEESNTPKIAELSVQDEYLPAVRDQGFRRAVVIAYNRRCALCGIKIVTVDGHTAVDAAHIIPWNVTHDDRLTNGMALCRLCHWGFDEGMLGVTGQYTLLTSPQLSSGMNIPAHLAALNGRGIIRPSEERHWPDLDAIHWHRREVFRPT
jgi:putative restriction endonuclease